MKKVFLTIVLLASSVWVQAQDATILRQSLEGMFEVDAVDLHFQIQALEGTQGPLNPAVPLDGGVIALIAAGAAIGYKKTRKSA